MEVSLIPDDGHLPSTNPLWGTVGIGYHPQLPHSPAAAGRRAIFVLAGAGMLTAVIVLAIGWPAGVALSWMAPPRRRSAAATQIVWLSDLHLNPSYTRLLGPKCKCFSYGPYLCAEAASSALPWPFDGNACMVDANLNPWGQYGCDSPFALAAAAIADASRACPLPAAVVITGDYVLHENCQLPVTDVSVAAADIVRALSTELERAFGSELEPVAHVRHVPELLGGIAGNNDFVPDYYLPNVTDGCLGPPARNLQAIAAALRPPLAPKQHERFVRGGGVRYDVGHIAVLALNTVIYSPAHEELVGKGGADPYGQFVWLDEQLHLLRRQRRPALLTGHIPPTVDQYSFKMEWLQAYADSYVRVVSRYTDVVRAQLFGHTHQNMLRAFPSLPLDPSSAAARTSASEGPPLFVSAAVSPVYGNNPPWTELILDPNSGDVSELIVHAAQLNCTSASDPPEWKAIYDARGRYSPHDVFSSAGLRAFAAALMEDDVLFAKYLLDRVSGAPGWADPPHVATSAYHLGRATPAAAHPSTSAGSATAEQWERDAHGEFRARIACGIADGYSQPRFDACVKQGGPPLPTEAR
jgi:sphingomyelin phosphodiesterase acid-like 3